MSIHKDLRNLKLDLLKEVHARLGRWTGTLNNEEALRHLQWDAVRRCLRECRKQRREKR